MTGWNPFLDGVFGLGALLALGIGVPAAFAGHGEPLAAGVLLGAVWLVTRLAWLVSDLMRP